LVKPLRIYRDVCYFEDGGRHLGFSQILRFTGRSAVEAMLLNFIKIGQKVASIQRLNGLQSSVRARASSHVLRRIGTVCGNDLAVAIIMQNFVEIDALVLIIRNV